MRKCCGLPPGFVVNTAGEALLRRSDQSADRLQGSWQNRRSCYPYYFNQLFPSCTLKLPRYTFTPRQRFLLPGLQKLRNAGTMMTFQKSSNKSTTLLKGCRNSRQIRISKFKNECVPSEWNSAFGSYWPKAANSLGLFAFINADLSQFRPRPAESYAFASDSAGFESTSTEPEFPKSLYLIHPLVSAYPLNPVASAAQANVPIPDGLDLDKWIVPPPKDIVPTPTTEMEERGRRPKKKKGKQKEANGKLKERAATKPLQEDVLTPAAETEEEKAERERVSFLPCAGRSRADYLCSETTGTH